jgi:1-phosphatidylinositol-4-phosphate 5-kinase
MFQRSVGPEQLLQNLIMGNLSTLSQQSSSGKSGSFFYYSQDDQFVLKTISKNEFYFFRRIIRNYYMHIMEK